MSFEVCYTGDATCNQFASSTEGTKGDEFFDKMDKLAKEYKSLTQGIEEELEEALEVAKEGARKALSEKYPDGRFELGYVDEDIIEVNSEGSNAEAKADEMLELCREYFDHEARMEGNGELDYEEFNTRGEITVDGKKVKLNSSDWEEQFDNQELFYEDQREEILNKDWYVNYYVQSKSAWTADIDEDKFDKSKLNWQNGMVYYGDTPIDNDIAGRRPIDESISLQVCGQIHDF